MPPMIIKETWSSSSNCRDSLLTKAHHPGTHIVIIIVKVEQLPHCHFISSIPYNVMPLSFVSLLNLTAPSLNSS